MENEKKKRGSRDEQHARRQTAIRLLEAGKLSMREIAESLGVSYGTVRGWSSKLQRLGKEKLQQKGERGRPAGSGSALTPREAARILALVRDRQPQQLKMPFWLWSIGAVQWLIEEKLGKKLSESCVRSYLKTWGLTVQRPATRYSRRNEADIQKWLTQDYPRLAAKAVRQKAEIHWLDETGINNQAVYPRGYAPRGQTPEVTLPPRQRISVLSTVTRRGKMRFRLYSGALKAAILIAFLESLLQETDQKLVVILDNLPVHRSQAVQAWVEAQKGRLTLAWLPPYAPELNPDEYLNNDLKQNVHRYSGLPRDKKELQSTSLAYLRHIQKRPDKVRAFFRAPKTSYAA